MFLDLLASKVLAPSPVPDLDATQLPDGVVPVTAVACLADLHHWFNVRFGRARVESVAQRRRCPLR